LRQIHTMTTDEQARFEALKEHNDELEAARG
jgi:hypothetical protein